MKKIICAVDDADHSKDAVVLASEMAKAMNAELVLVAVNPFVGGRGAKGGIAAYVWDEPELKGILDRAVKEAKKAGFDAPKAISIKSRDVPRAITAYAEENGANHIVVGSGSKGSVSRLMFGSVSRDVVFRAHCPVTVAR